MVRSCHGGDGEEEVGVEMKFLFLILMALPALAEPHAVSYLPDPVLTPGAVNAVATIDLLRGPSFVRSSRHVTRATKRAVFIAYFESVPDHPEEFEVDHLIPLENGGSNDISNLWPEPLHFDVNGFDLGAKTKDRAENATHKAMLRGEITLEEVQNISRKDWTILYKRFVSEVFPKFVR